MKRPSRASSSDSFFYGHLSFTQAALQTPNMTWYDIEGSPEGDVFIFFGWVHSDFPELGYFSLQEMQENTRPGSGARLLMHLSNRMLRFIRQNVSNG